MITSLTSCTNNEDNSLKELRPETREDFIRFYKFISDDKICENRYLPGMIQEFYIDEQSYSGKIFIAQTLIECFNEDKATIHTPPVIFP
jgi:hypothetical protein